jgi:hypothetical protein
VVKSAVMKLKLTDRGTRGRAACVLAAGVLGIGMAMATAGCEKRIVAVHNPYIQSQVNIQPAPTPVAPQRGFLDNLWDALFGWTRPAPATNGISSQPSMFHPTNVQSSQ